MPVIRSITVSLDFEILRTHGGKVVGNPCSGIDIAVTGEYEPAETPADTAHGIRLNGMRLNRNWPMDTREFDATIHAGVNTAAIEVAVRAAVERLFQEGGQ